MDRAAVCLILLGCALRLLCLEGLPYDLNQDEASAGYEAWALLQSGMDRNGNSWPVLFVSWGSGQNVLMSYLAMPFIAVLGLSPLSVRLPNAIAGCVSLFLMWRLASRCRGRRFGLCALFLLTINPWHIMASRWALESNLLPAFLLAACSFLSMAEKRPKALYPAAVILGLMLYAYGTAFLFLPPFLLCTFLCLRRKIRPGQMLLPFLVFVAVALPITLCQMINVLHLNEMSILGVTFPRLTENRQNAVSILGGGGLSALRENMNLFLNILHNGDDGNLYNALPYWQGGILFFFGVPLAVGGFISFWMHRKENDKDWPMTSALFSGLLCVPLINGNINRLNMLWIPLIYFSAAGLYWLLRRLDRWRIPILAGVGACFLYFSYSYVRTFASPGHGDFFPGLGPAIQAARQEKRETLYITEDVREPYIFALFYDKIQPEIFVQSVIYTDPETDFRPVERFEGYDFTNPDRCDLLILPKEKTENMETLGVYGNYAVCRHADDQKAP